MMKRLLLLLVPVMALGQSTIPAGSSRAAATRLLTTPRLEYSRDIPVDSLPAWREQMSAEMARLMKHPEAEAKAPELISADAREGYTLERWCSWPLADYPVHYLVLRPDSAVYPGPRPAALCIPGFGQTKELLAGEQAVTDNSQALHLVRQGFVAMAVDNPCFGELSDNGYSDFLATSRMLLEADWSYLGLASWQDRVALEHLKRMEGVDRSCVIVSGFSLGTEPMMVLGLLDPEIYAFVYNDFLCRTRERILVMDKPNGDGSRPLPNSIEHLIPGFLLQFDFPDIVAALAPRPLICTEGGLDRDLLLVADAYTRSGAAEAFEYHHYPKFAEERVLGPTDSIPAGIDRTTFFRLANVDPPAHGYKHPLILPWLEKVIK